MPKCSRNAAAGVAQADVAMVLHEARVDAAATRAFFERLNDSLHESPMPETELPALLLLLV